MKREGSYQFPKERVRKENSWSGLRIKDSLSNSKFQFKIFIPELKIPHSKFQIQSQVSSFKISNFQIASFQNLKF